MVKNNKLSRYVTPKPTNYTNITIARESYQKIKDLSLELNTTITGTVDALLRFYEETDVIDD